MIKRTLFFGNPAYLSVKNEQLVVELPDKEREKHAIPLEDIGVIVLENPRITLTNVLLNKINENKVLLITCDSKYMPVGIFQSFNGNTLFNERLRKQLLISEPLKKQLWQQTVYAKIINQALLLEENGINADKLRYWAKEVKSGDIDNQEACAAAYYFQHIMPIHDFARNQEGVYPNNLLNYGYAILRGITARAITATGLLPALGIFHKNKYNPYCLADDIMEPFRPFVDKLVLEIIKDREVSAELTIEIKKELLKIPVLDVSIDDKNSPLMVAMSRTTNSFYECIEGSRRKIIYPVFC